MREGGTRALKDLLEKYRRSICAPEGSVIKVFVEAAEKSGFAVDPAHVSYKPPSRTIIVSLSGPKKSEILLKKKELLEACERALGQKNAPKHIV